MGVGSNNLSAGRSRHRIRMKASRLSTSYGSTRGVHKGSALSTPPQRSSDTPPTSPSNASSSTETVKVGLGVGLGIGIPLVLIAGIWIGLKSVKQRKSSSRGTDSAVQLSEFANMEYPTNSYPPRDESMHYADQTHESPQIRSELPGETALIELGSDES